MKIAIAQLHPLKGDIATNIKKHHQLIQLALAREANAIFFSELSLTSYEPTLAKQLALYPNDGRLKSFQSISNQEDMLIGVGMPTPSQNGIRISMAIFRPNTSLTFYHKQQLHDDELPYFVAGDQQIIIEDSPCKIAPAICYESLQLNHAHTAAVLGATIYLASVAKSQKGVEKAKSHYPTIAQRFGFPVLMVNCIGFCDNFESVGQSAVWNTKGKLLAQLNSEIEGILMYNTQTKEVSKQIL